MDLSKCMNSDGCTPSRPVILGRWNQHSPLIGLLDILTLFYLVACLPHLFSHIIYLLLGTFFAPFGDPHKPHKT